MGQYVDRRDRSLQGNIIAQIPALIVVYLLLFVVFIETGLENTFETPMTTTFSRVLTPPVSRAVLLWHNQWALTLSGTMQEG